MTAGTSPWPSTPLTSLSHRQHSTTCLLRRDRAGPAARLTTAIYASRGRAWHARLRARGGGKQGFIFPGATPRDIALAALDPSPAVAERRAELAPYLERFAALLGAEFVLEPLFVRLYEDRWSAVGRGGGCGVERGRKAEGRLEPCAATHGAMIFVSNGSS